MVKNVREVHKIIEHTRNGVYGACPNQAVDGLDGYFIPNFGLILFLDLKVCG